MANDRRDGQIQRAGRDLPGPACDRESAGACRVHALAGDEGEVVEVLYFGPPDAQRYCAFQYMKGGKLRPDRRCPNPISFYIKIPDGRGDDWRKAWASCADHLATVIWQMQEM